MAHSEDIDKAIAAHGAWKQRLVTAVNTGTSEFNVPQVQVDNRCDFGKWLYGLPAQQRDTQIGHKVQALHASFHKEAARILGLALSGRKDEALKALGVGSEFGTLSGQLSLSLMQWKGTL